MYRSQAQKRRQAWYALVRTHASTNAHRHTHIHTLSLPLARTHPDEDRDQQADKDVARVGEVEAEVPAEDDAEVVAPGDAGVGGVVAVAV